MGFGSFGGDYDFGAVFGGLQRHGKTYASAAAGDIDDLTGKLPKMSK